MSRGTAVQLKGMNGLAARSERRWMARARISLPVPLLPQAAGSQTWGFEVDLPANQWDPGWRRRVGYQSPAHVRADPMITQPAIRNRRRCRREKYGTTSGAGRQVGRSAPAATARKCLMVLDEWSGEPDFRQLEPDRWQVSWA
jgi:hypothetical protein